MDTILADTTNVIRSYKQSSFDLLSVLFKTKKNEINKQQQKQQKTRNKIA